MPHGRPQFQTFRRFPRRVDDVEVGANETEDANGRCFAFGQVRELSNRTGPVIRKNGKMSEVALRRRPVFEAETQLHLRALRSLRLRSRSLSDAERTH